MFCWSNLMVQVELKFFLAFRKVVFTMNFDVIAVQHQFQRAGMFKKFRTCKYFPNICCPGRKIIHYITEYIKNKFWVDQWYELQIKINRKTPLYRYSYFCSLPQNSIIINLCSKTVTTTCPFDLNNNNFCCSTGSGFILDLRNIS